MSNKRVPTLPTNSHRGGRLVARSLSAGPRTLSVEAPVHGPEVLCLYVILALLEIYNHFRQSSPSSADVRVPVYWGLTVEAAQGLCAGGKWSVSNP